MNDNYIKIIQINDKLTRYEKEIKRLKTEKKDIENCINELIHYTMQNKRNILCYLMNINYQIKQFSHKIYKLYNYKNNIINKHYKIIQKQHISKGENTIFKILNSLIYYKIILYYEKEHILPIKYIRHLRADFYILDNQLTKYIIEYHGKQHYQYLKHYHKNYKQFIQYKKKDQMKKEYCEKNNIKYLCISYKVDKILFNSIINDFIKS